MAERQITLEEQYQIEMREMQKEINYLRMRVAKLSDELSDHRKHTDKAMKYIEESLEEIDDAASQGHA
tara:strand:- start:403 stop:606 length:204 start_codon:yes stop_codon:yes gene_type:complete